VSTNVESNLDIFDNGDTREAKIQGKRKKEEEGKRENSKQWDAYFTSSSA
jgi:hypothetical protein